MLGPEFCEIHGPLLFDLFDEFFAGTDPVDKSGLERLARDKNLAVSHRQGLFPAYAAPLFHGRKEQLVDGIDPLLQVGAHLIRQRLHRIAGGFVMTGSEDRVPDARAFQSFGKFAVHADDADAAHLGRSRRSYPACPGGHPVRRRCHETIGPGVERLCRRGRAYRQGQFLDTVHRAAGRIHVQQDGPHTGVSGDFLQRRRDLAHGEQQAPAKELEPMLAHGPLHRDDGQPVFHGVERRLLFFAAARTAGIRALVQRIGEGRQRFRLHGPQGGEVGDRHASVSSAVSVTASFVSGDDVPD